MIILLVSVALVGVIAGTLLVYRYAAIFPYMMITYMGWFYIFPSNDPIKLGGVNVYIWDLLFLVALLNIVFRIMRDGVAIPRSSRWLIFGLFFYMGWLEFSEIFNFMVFDTGRGLDNLVRVSISSLYPLIAISIAISLKERIFLSLMKYLVFICVIVSIWLLIKEILDIGAHVTSSGSIGRGRGEMTVLLNIGLGIILFSRSTHVIIKIIGAGLILMGIALLSHRSAFLGTGLMLLIYFVYLAKSKVETHKAIFATAVGTFSVAVLVLFILFSNISAIESFRNRLASTVDTDNTTSVGRLQKWTVAWKSTQENPIGGTRLNGLPDWYGNYLLEADFGRFSIAEGHGAYIYLLGQATPWPPHNMFINILSRNGWVGLFSFMVLLLGAFAALRSKDREAYLCGSSIILGNMVFLTFNNHFAPDTTASLAVCLVSIPIRLSMSEQLENA